MSTFVALSIFDIEASKPKAAIPAVVLSTAGMGDRTDAGGNYELKMPVDGTYRIIAVYSVFSVAKTATLVQGATTTVDFDLNLDVNCQIELWGQFDVRFFVGCVNQTAASP
ncbi:hypothetical protein SCOR_14835 [Sulfidibacter corallicola]|uniref:Carboxypeptidase regulatory-like domain-containing protein n=1 Tax=Sulfidibacter corallicola TaxID=2818388 RepID=A0A8A4TYF3_SULCO|nr:hypothetical protein [Sulfidibacter corallicola]QTD54258.1 hypothetical protein J3U87_17575 [Sulfidibacter corallicola]